MTRAVRITLWGALAVSATCDAHAASLSEVLALDRVDELCTNDPSGRRLVNPERLASALVTEAGVPFVVRDRANPAGIASNSVTPEEDVYLITHADAVQPTTDIGKRSIERLSPMRQALGEYLNELTGDEVDARVFQIVPLPQPVPSKTKVEALFDSPAGLAITCTPIAETKPPEPPSWDFRLRGNIEDLRVRDDGSEDVLSDVSAGTVSLQSDDIADTDTFDVNLVAGVHFDLSPEKGRYNAGIQPYVHYEHREVSGDGDNSGDTDKVTAGALADFFVYGESWAMSFGFYPQYITDFELNSEAAMATAFVVPDFAIDLSKDYTFYTGAYNYIGSTLRVKPELKLVANADYVLDAGQNPDLADHDDFYAAGGEASLSFLFDTEVPVLEHMSIDVSYRWLDLFSTSKDDLRRFEAKLGYDLFGNKNAVAELAYVDGEDMQTQQDEEYWRLALGLKF